uniref:Uncharacterized protein n=1 Tax=Arundo donax TaxID=35708 RepID=A0A0A8YV24_ARUDO
MFLRNWLVVLLVLVAKAVLRLHWRGYTRKEHSINR